MKYFFKESNLHYLIPISIVLSGSLVSVAILAKFGLDTLQKLFSILGSLSLGVALLAYFYKKRQDETSAAIDQIGFFREKIIPKWSEVQIAIRNKGYNPVFIKFDKPDINEIRSQHSKNFERQLAMFFDASKVEADEFLDNSILDQQIFLLNMLEDFSLKVVHFETTENPALLAVGTTFSQIVEQNAVAIMFMREVVLNDDAIYSNTLSLYALWGKKFEKQDLIKNLWRFGFISKTQKESVFKRRREYIETETNKTT